MRLLKPFIFALFGFCAAIGLAQVPVPQINLSGTGGVQGSPFLNNGTLPLSSDANHAMTAPESSATGGLKITSTVALTNTRSIVIPSTFGNLQFLAIENATTGGQSINVCSGTGTTCGGGLPVTIQNGQTVAGVWFDGTNVVVGSGGGIPGGSSGSIQINNSGAFGGATSSQIQTAIGTSVYDAYGAGTSAVQNLFGSATPGAGQVPFFNSGTGKYAPTTLTPAIIGASVAPSLPTAAVANFELAGGQTGNTSTTVVDTTGNGNTLTFGTSTRAPVWAANGLQFVNNQGADFPAGSVTTALTFCGYGYFQPLGLTTINTSGYPSLITSSLGSASNASTISLNYTGTYGRTLGYSPNGIFAFTGYTNTIKTSSNSLLYGELAFCYIMGTAANSTTDTIYLSNGVETYSVQGATGGVQTTGYLSLCAGLTTFTSGCGNLLLQGLTVYAGQLTGVGSLTQSQAVQQQFAYYYNDATNHGVSFTPPTYVQTTTQEFVVGDSIDNATYVSPSSSAWYSNRNYTNTITPLTVTSYAIATVDLLAEAASEPWRIAPYCQSQFGGAFVDLGGGTNDAAGLPVTPIQAAGELFSEVNALSAAGCRVFIRTMISRTGNAQIGGTLDAWAATYNTIIRTAGLVLSKAVGLSDWAANPYVGATYASNGGNTSGTCQGANTYFTGNPTYPTGSPTGDCVHPNANAEGASGPITSANNNSHNYVSYTYGLSNMYALTATQTETITAGQVYTDATACTSCVLTLPDGIGPTGGTYYVLTGSGTVTVQGQTLWGQTQTVTGNGSINATGAVTLPTGKLVALKIVALPQATAGVKWVF